MKPTVISTFAGCGGSSLGYKMAGFKELLAIDFDKNSVDTFRLNFPEVTVWQKDIKEVTGKEILKETGLKKGELDVFDGSPPCQGFSTAGKRKIKDERNDLFQEFARLIEELEPKVFVMENVSGMIKGKMKGRFIEIIERLKKTRYFVKCKKLNAANYGVPQSRERLFFIGIRPDIIKKEQDWTDIFPKPYGKPITVKEALQGFKIGPNELIIRPTGRLKQYSNYIKPGQRLCDYTKKTSGFSIRRLEWNRPMWTVTKTFQSGISGFLHPTENRFITISELKRLSSFPDDFKFTGKFEEQWARIGNAVMPLQMKAIATQIKKKLEEKQ